MAAAFTAILLLGRGAVACASANAYWGPAFNDPTRVDITDISNLIRQVVPYSDPMDDVRRSLLVLLPAGQVVFTYVGTAHDGSPRAYRPRAPPSA
jgi:hypothetical protein